MELALPVLDPKRPDRALLKPGAKLDTPAIQRLRELSVPCVWIHYPALDSIARFVDPRVLAARGRLAHMLGEAIGDMAGDVDPELSFVEYATAIRHLIDHLNDNGPASVFLFEMVDRDRPLLMRSSDVCYLCLLMGLKLDGYLISQRRRISPSRAKNIDNLGLGALLHDIGMLKLDAATLELWETERDTKDRGWREHVLLGYRMVQGHIPPTAAVMVLDHHQKFNGTGFPLHVNEAGESVGKRGNEIHIFARILAVAETYETLRHPPGLPRDAESATPRVRVLREMLEMSRTEEIDPVVFKALLHVVPPYPPGETVVLSDGSEAIVFDWDPLEPCRPIVCPISVVEEATNEEEAEGMQLDLRRLPELHVAGVNGHDVEADNFESQSPYEFDLRWQVPADELPDDMKVRSGSRVHDLLGSRTKFPLDPSDAVPPTDGGDERPPLVA